MEFLLHVSISYHFNDICVWLSFISNYSILWLTFYIIAVMWIFRWHNDKSFFSDFLRACNFFRFLISKCQMIYLFCTFWKESIDSIIKHFFFYTRPHGGSPNNTAAAFYFFFVFFSVFPSMIISTTTVTVSQCTA